MTDVYVVVWVDRHTDIEVEPFDQEAAAIEWVKAEARDDDIVLNEELTAAMREDGWVYHATYSTEDDYLFVVKREVRWPADASN